MFQHGLRRVFKGDERWRHLRRPRGDRYEWDDDVDLRAQAAVLRGHAAEPEPLPDIIGARVLAVLGDSVTTDHISPAGTIRKDSPAGQWLVEHGVTPADFNSYGARRGNHEVMIRGTFANIRLRNQLAPGTEGGVTLHLPDGEADVDLRRRRCATRPSGVPLVILAGKEYGSGSSRDWAAKGTALLGVRAVIAESYERIHRSNLIGMGVLPLQFLDGDTVGALGLTGRGDDHHRRPRRRRPRVAIARTAHRAGRRQPFEVRLRIDTPKEADYYRHGGILPYVLRQHLAAAAAENQAGNRFEPRAAFPRLALLPVGTGADRPDYET